jgi:hypothetical protein
MELKIKVGEARQVFGPGRRQHLVEEIAEDAQRFVLVLDHDAAGGVRFEVGAQGVHFFDLVLGDRRDEGTAMGIADQQPLLLELAKRFTYWSATHPKLLGKVRFKDPVARPQLAGDDHALKLIDDSAAERAGLEPFESCRPAVRDHHGPPALEIVYTVS